jgi:hypothetical protein
MNQLLLVLHSLVQPGARDLPFAFHGRRRDSQDFGSLINRQTREIPKLNNAALLFIEFLEFTQSAVEFKQILIVLDRDRRRIFQRDFFGAPLKRLPLSCRVDQKPPHRLSRDSEKLAAIFPVNGSLIRQFEISFMHQLGCLERDRVFSFQETGGQAAQFVINDRQETVESGTAVFPAAPNLLQKHGNFVRHNNWADCIAILA